ncbi:hypothetical protein JOH51_004166 [Rhizobium leguminosarum]|nr:hypothetical protein [Rhizobium leguminosarum]
MSNCLMSQRYWQMYSMLCLNADTGTLHFDRLKLTPDRGSTQ